LTRDFVPIMRDRATFGYNVAQFRARRGLRRARERTRPRAQTRGFG
jgi:hypothetical protein